VNGASARLYGRDSRPGGETELTHPTRAFSPSEDPLPQELPFPQALWKDSCSTAFLRTRKRRLVGSCGAAPRRVCPARLIPESGGTVARASTFAAGGWKRGEVVPELKIALLTS